MTHLWVRAEQRLNEERVGLTPEGAAALVAAGIRVSVEESHVRAIPIDGYRAAGCEIVAENLWPKAPADAIIFGLKELPEDGTPLTHRHIMFGHAYKGQPAGRVLLDRFSAGGGTLYDLEYLVDETGRRVAAFGYWAGYAGASVALKCWAAQQRRQGLATRLLRAYQGYVAATTPQLQEVRLICKEPLIPLYAGAGFEMVGPSDVVHGQDPWFEMRWAVDSSEEEGEEGAAAVAAAAADEEQQQRQQQREEGDR